MPAPKHGHSDWHRLSRLMSKQWKGIQKVMCPTHTLGRLAISACDVDIRTLRYGGAREWQVHQETGGKVGGRGREGAWPIVIHRVSSGPLFPGGSAILKPSADQKKTGRTNQQGHRNDAGERKTLPHGDHEGETWMDDGVHRVGGM